MKENYWIFIHLRLSAIHLLKQPTHSFAQLVLSVVSTVEEDVPVLLASSVQEGDVPIDGQPIAASKQAGSSLWLAWWAEALGKAWAVGWLGV